MPRIISDLQISITGNAMQRLPEKMYPAETQHAVCLS